MSTYEPDRLSKFFLTTVEQQARRELLLGADVGVPIRCVGVLNIKHCNQQVCGWGWGCCGWGVGGGGVGGGVLAMRLNMAMQRSLLRHASSAVV